MNLQATRREAGKTQVQVAKEAHISETTYQLYEYDKIEPGVRTAIRIAQALGVETLPAFYALWQESISIIPQFTMQTQREHEFKGDEK